MSAFVYQLPTSYLPGAQIDLSDVDYARALASGAIVNPNTVIVSIGDSALFRSCRRREGGAAPRAGCDGLGIGRRLLDV